MYLYMYTQYTHILNLVIQDGYCINSHLYHDNVIQLYPCISLHDLAQSQGQNPQVPHRSGRHQLGAVQDPIVQRQQALFLETADHSGETPPWYVCIWLVVSTPLKNKKVSWDFDSQDMVKLQMLQTT